MKIVFCHGFEIDLTENNNPGFSFGNPTLPPSAQQWDIISRSLIAQ
jgi:hypothetical protein